MGAMKDLLIGIYGGGEQAVEGAMKLAGLARWSPVTNESPPDGWVLVTVEQNGVREVGVARVVKGMIHPGCDSPDMVMRVTHWMPLPEPADGDRQS